MDLIELLEIEVTKQTQNEIILSMPVLDKHKQPFGLVHGGIYGILIESAASIGGLTNVSEGEVVVGTDLHVNHLKAAREGILTTIAHPNHIGKTLQVWEATIYNEQKEKIAIGRCSLLNKQLPTKKR